jgi:hypothetical protein
MASREWGSCDILIHFIECIEQAYLNGTPLSFGGNTFSAAEIATIVDTLDIVIFPQGIVVPSNRSRRGRAAPAPPRLPEGRVVPVTYDA